MKKVFLILVSVAVFGFSTVVLAVSSNGNVYGQTNSSSSGNSSTSSNSSNTETQNQIQTQTNNPGTGTQTQTQNQTQEKLQLQERIQDSKPEYLPRSEQAKARMSEVAKAVEYLIRVAERIENKGIGDQIRTIARTQSENCDKINQDIDRVQQRSAFAYFFVGSNFSEIKGIQALMGQNRVQIQELEKLKLQLTNQADQLEIANQIILLQNQQTELREQLHDLSSRFSLFGWLNRWIHGVSI